MIGAGLANGVDARPDRRVTARRAGALVATPPRQRRCAPPAAHGARRGSSRQWTRASLAVFRIAFGSLLLWEVWKYVANGWIARYYVDPAFHFTYYGFEWVRPWPGPWMYVHVTVLGVLAACIALGACYRLAAGLFFLGFSYLFLLEQARYLNHLYLVCLLGFLLAWCRPTGRSRSTPGSGPGAGRPWCRPGRSGCFDSRSPSRTSTAGSRS